MNKRQDDALEKFIKDNRKALDQFELPDNLWGKISEGLDSEENPPLDFVSSPNPQLRAQGREEKAERVIQIKYSTLWRAAAVFLLLMGVFGIWMLQKPSGLGDTTLAEAQIPLENIAPELAEAENYYTQLINQKQAEIAQFPLEDFDVDEEFKPALHELDSMYTHLKTELYKVPSQEEIINAMVSNLQMRIQILNQQLEILKQIQNLKNRQEDDPISL